MRQVVLVLALVSALLAAGGAQAQSSVDAYDFELRGGSMAHSVDDPDSPDAVFNFLDVTRVEDVNVELLFRSPDNDIFRAIGSPRPHVGATLNFGGLESMVYGGLTWRAHLFDSPVFVEGSFGGAFVDGDLHNAVYPRRSIGCNVMFHESASLGYDITEQASVMMTVEHASHAYLCGDDNRGLTNLGVRFGYKF